MALAAYNTGMALTPTQSKIQPGGELRMAMQPVVQTDPALI